MLTLYSGNLVRFGFPSLLFPVNYHDVAQLKGLLLELICLYSQ